MDIQRLRNEIELKFGREITSPSDFDALYLAIKKETGKELSVSTLKRIWEYVKTDSSPRFESLSILARYLGFIDWKDFINSDKISDSSDFLDSDIIESKNLKEGDIVRLNWAPNRECDLKYLGKDRYKVLNAVNSKLQKDDIINCSIFAQGEPLLCYEIERDDKIIAEGYIAARRRGIQTIKLITHSDR
ncbi:MAG: hypothetical protein J1F43_06600 [Muribaculaceae bacterium]|nr:hypothetical protein [Muribaculaceae bacterium]